MTGSLLNSELNQTVMTAEPLWGVFLLLVVLIWGANGGPWQFRGL